MPKVDLVAELAQKILHTLEQQRQSGSDYPLSVARLVALADPQATPEQVSKALAKKPFAAKWIVASKKDPNSPIALAEDVERLAASPLLLEYALGLVCSADKPVHAPTKALGKVDKALKPAFKAALDRQIAEQTLPSSVGVVLVKKKPQLYLQQFPPPPPPPPKKKPAEELSEKLVQVLAEQRERGTDGYPTPLDRLLEMTGLPATPTAVKAALKLDPFANQALLAMPKQADTLVALAADFERLAASPALLHRVLSATRTRDTQIVTLADVKKKLNARLQESFIESVNRCLASGVLPDGVGVLHIKKKPLLFLLADINISPPTIPPPKTVAAPIEPKSATPLAVDFAPLFEETFARLDREHGSHNHVSLVALRQAMSVERGAFDAALQQLRRAGRYSLSAAEGRHGISTEEQDAGIREDGSLLLFVSRRET